MDRHTEQPRPPEPARDATGRTASQRRPLSTFDRIIRHPVLKILTAVGVAAAGVGIADQIAPGSAGAPGAVANEVGNIGANTAIGAVELGQDILKGTGKPDNIYIGTFNVKDLNKLTVWSQPAPVETTSAENGAAEVDISMGQISSLDGTRVDIQGLTGISFTNATVINKHLPDNADQSLGPNIEIVADAAMRDGSEKSVYIPLGKYNAGVVEEVPGGQFVDIQVNPDGKPEAPTFGITSDKVNIISYTGQNGEPVTQPVTPANAAQN